MKKTLFGLVTGWIILAAGCAGQPPLPPGYDFGKNALVIHVKTAKEILPSRGSEALLSLCVHQLNETGAFERYADEPLGLETLKECVLMPPGGVCVKELGIRPGQDYTFVLDRAEGSRFVGLVAGYAGLGESATVRLFEIPVIEIKKGWMLRRSLQETDLVIRLTLGPAGIESAETASHDD